MPRMSASSSSSSSPSSSSAAPAPPSLAALSFTGLLEACEAASDAPLVLGSERFLVPAAWWKAFVAWVHVGADAQASGLGSLDKPGALDPGADLGDKAHPLLLGPQGTVVSAAARPRSLARARARITCGQ